MFYSKLLRLVTVLAVAITVNGDCTAKVFFNRAYNYDVVKGIDGNKRFSELSFVGTHHSISYIIDDPTEKTQDWSLNEQLESGIRILHFNVKSKSNDFEISLENIQLPLKFSVDILPMINEFLDVHPDEFVIVYLTQDDESSSESNCKTLDEIKASSSGYRVSSKWTVDDLVRDYRGKIIIAGDKSFKGCCYNLKSECANDMFVPTNTVDDIIYKWKAIKNLQDSGFLRRHDCYMQHLYLPNDSQKNLKAIALEGGFETSDGRCAEPLNVKMIKHFKSSPEAFNIVMADFVTQKLIDTVTGSNFGNQY